MKTGNMSLKRLLKEKKDINAHLLHMVQKMLNQPSQHSEEASIGKNFKLSVFVSALRDKVQFLLKGKHGYHCDAGIGEKQDNMLRIQNLLKIFPKREEETLHEIENLQLNLQQAEKRADAPFSREQELQNDLSELCVLEEKLSVLSLQTDSLYDPEEEAEPVKETAEEKAKREALYSADPNDYQPTEEDSPEQFLPNKK